MRLNYMGTVKRERHIPENIVDKKGHLLADEMTRIG